MVNDVVFANAINRNCASKRIRKEIKVNTTPNAPTIKDDSICLNSVANLIATTNAGQIRWYTDSTTLVTIHSGSVLQVGPLSKDTFFFAKAINGACTHPGRVRVKALVSSAFAPKEPSVSNDTTICLLHGDIQLKASGTHTLRWFDVAAGGTALTTGSTFSFTPTTQGIHSIYVDAYDGKCAISRLPIDVDVNHFPELPDLADKEACQGQIILFDYQSIDGEIDWFASSTGGSKVYGGTFRIFDNVLTNETFYLEPFQGGCKDTVRHKWTYEAIAYGTVLSETIDTQACDGTIPSLEINSDVGDVVWYDSTGNNILFTGPNFVTDPFTQNKSYWHHIDNRGCITAKKKHDITWRIMPDANYDYQITWREVVFASKLISQGDYVWRFDDGTDTSMGTDVTHHFYEDRTYNVSLTVESPFECIDTVIKPITINTVGIDKLGREIISVYPNPSFGLINIETSSDFRPDYLEILNQNGQVVFEKKSIVPWQRYTLEIKSTDLPEGVYFIRCSNNNETVTSRFTLLNN